MSTKLTVFAAATVLAAGATHAATFNWPQPGITAAHTAYNAHEKTLSKANLGKLSLAWTFATQGEILAQPVELNGRLFVLSTDGTLYARSAATGTALWSYTAVPGGFAGANWGVSAAGNLVYASCQTANVPNVGTQNGVCALNASTGKLVWSYALTHSGNGSLITSAPDSPPIVDGGLVIFGEQDLAYGENHLGYLTALNASTGAVVWTHGDCGDGGNNCYPGLGSAPIAVADGGVFFQATATVQPGGTGYVSTVCRLVETTGANSWCYDFATVKSNSSPTVAKGRVLFGFENTDYATSTLVALNETTGAVVWTRVVQADGGSPPAVAGNTAYFVALGNEYGSVYALSVATGKLLWTYASGGAAGDLVSPVSVANGIVYGQCAGAPGLCTFDAKTGAVLASEGVAGDIVAPVVANGAVIEGCNSNDVCAYKP